MGNQKVNLRILINWLLFGVFLSFAWLQFNDSDPAIWVSIYALVGLLFGISNFKKVAKVWVLVLMLALGIFALFHVPHFIEWLKSPNKSELFGEMVYEKPYIEGSREFMGLLIAILALVYLLKQKHD